MRCVCVCVGEMISMKKIFQNDNDNDDDIHAIFMPRS